MGEWSAVAKILHKKQFSLVLLTEFYFEFPKIQCLPKQWNHPLFPLEFIKIRT
jgi:hypothetical protein